MGMLDKIESNLSVVLRRIQEMANVRKSPRLPGRLAENSCQTEILQEFKPYCKPTLHLE